MITSTEQLFTDARTQNGYQPEPVSDATLRQLYDLMKWGPTAANSTPARLVFVRSAQGKDKLLGCVSPGNVNKVREAPVTVIVGMDLDFHEQLPKLFPHTDARAWFVDDAAKRAESAMRNSSLQGGYLIMAARAGPGLRADERIRPRQDRRRVLGRHGRQDQLHLRAGPGRSVQGVPAQPAPELRRGLPTCMTGWRRGR